MGEKRTGVRYDRKVKRIRVAPSRIEAVSNPIDVAACKEEDKMAVGERTDDKRQKGGFPIRSRNVAPPGYQLDSVSLSTDPKVTESFRDYLNGRIDRSILWVSRKGYCSALRPPVPRISNPSAAVGPRESWLSATRGCPAPSCLYTHLIYTPWKCRH